MTVGGRITITGVTRRGQARGICLPLAQRIPAGHRLVMSVLANAATIGDRRPQEYGGRFARRDEIGQSSPRRARRAGRRCSYDLGPGGDLVGEVERLVAEIGVAPDWLQVNGLPSVEDVRGLCHPGEARGPAARVILQLPAPVLQRFEGADETERLADWLVPCVDAGIPGVLLDESGGRGVPLDLHRAVRRLRGLAVRFSGLDYGAAGGLHQANLSRLVCLLDRVPLLSVDVESGVRCSERDELLEAEAITFVDGGSPSRAVGTRDGHGCRSGGLQPKARMTWR